MHAFALLLFLVTAANSGDPSSAVEQAPPPVERIASNGCVLESFVSMLYGTHGHVEVAEFIVDERGTLTGLTWPREEWVRAQRYTGIMPSGTVAIAHTHPENSAEPSYDDISTAKRLQLPVYVVTRRAIWTIDPLPQVQITKIAGVNWWSAVTRSQRCPKARVAR